MEKLKAEIREEVLAKQSLRLAYFHIAKGHYGWSN